MTKASNCRKHIRKYRLRYGAAIGIAATGLAMTNPILGGAIKGALYLMPFIGL